MLEKWYKVFKFCKIVYSGDLCSFLILLLPISPAKTTIDIFIHVILIVHSSLAEQFLQSKDCFLFGSCVRK